MMDVSMVNNVAAEKRGRIAQASSGVVVALASLIGLVGFLYPFILPGFAQHQEEAARQQAHANDAPLLFALLTGACLAAIIVSLTQEQWRRGEAARSVALLGALVSLDAALRLVPSFLGATPIFLLIILCGAVFGASFGFQMGSLTLLVSALLTGGIGPWLPFQMIGAGWVGMTAGWLPRLESRRQRVAMIAAFAAVWGFLFGALLNLWFWPFTAVGSGGSSVAWVPGLSLGETVQRYGAFYLSTSFVFDAFRAAGNAVLVIALGGPILSLLERFKGRFGWEPFELMPDQ
jgi:energy-coupling factor transport system substrate-specific component